MRNFLLKTWLCLTLISLASASIVVNVAAQASENDGIKLTISPLPISISAKPGEKITHQLRIKNSGNKREALEPSLLIFSSDQESGKPQLSKPSPVDDYIKWINFSPNTIALDPQQWGEVEMLINIPDSAAFGYYFAVTWSRAQSDGEPQAAANLIGSVAQLVLLEVQAPGTKRELKVESFKSNNSWYEFLPVNFTATLNNSGNVHTAPYGNIFIAKGEDQVGSIQFNPDHGNILPGSKRIFEVQWQEGFPLFKNKEQDGKVVLNSQGQPQRYLDWNIEQAEWWRFGKYTATMILAYDYEGQDVPLSAETEFWIVPWRLILLALAIPIIPTVLMYFFMRWRHRSQVGD